MLLSIEALCRVAAEPSPIPGLVLWDRRFGLWMAVFDDAICLSIGTEVARKAIQSIVFERPSSTSNS